MIITVDRSIGDEVWIMCHDKPCKSQIRNIVVRTSYHKENTELMKNQLAINIRYLVKGLNGDYCQNELFDTKEKLVLSLLQD